MRKILITGGAGFIGSNLSKRLVHKGYEVTVLDSLSPQIHGEPDSSPLYLSIKDEVRFIRGDVRCRDDMEKAIKGQEAVIHLAAETGTGQSMYEIERYVDVNARGTAVLLDILANQKHAIQKIIVASSRAVYGEGKYQCRNCGVVYPESRSERDMDKGDFECKCPRCRKSVTPLATDEESRLHPASVYGITKSNQEQMTLEVGKALNIPAAAFRYQNVYGPGQSLSNPYTGILSIFSTCIKNGKSINIFEDGRESRDFVYIDDAVDATILGLEKEAADFNVFNVGSGVPVDVLTVAKNLAENYKADSEIYISGNYRLGDIRHNYADLAKIKRLLGYEPQWDFKRGIKVFCSWVNQQDIHEDRYTDSIKQMKVKGLFKD